MRSGAYVGAFGKIPQMGDFLRVRANTEPQVSFEKWAEQAMAWGASRRGASWQNVHGSWPIQAFIYRPPQTVRSPSVLAGVLKPSHDSVNRRFPLVVFSPLEEKVVAAAPHLLPLWLGDFLEAATEVAMASPTIMSAANFEARVSGIAPPNVDEASSREYDDWSRATRLVSAWSTIYGDPMPDTPIHAIATIAEALKPFREVETPATPLSVRVPLGHGGAAAAVFWIDIVRRLAKWKTTVPSCFWSFDGVRGSLLIQLGFTPPSSLAEIWFPDPNSDHVCDLEAPTKTDRARLLARLPAPVAALFDREDARVVQLLTLLSQ